MDYNRLDVKIVTAWRIARLIRLAVFIAVSGIPTLILSMQDFFRKVVPYVYPAEVVILLYLLITLFLYPVIEYHQWGYIISDDRVSIRHGIFFIETTIIPVIRIQHVTIGQGPVLRRLGLSKVIIHTASGAFAIEGLSNQEAGTIADALKAKLYTRLEERDRV